MRLVVWLILLAQCALSQSLVQPDIPRTGDRALRCSAEPTRPILLYTVAEMAAGFTYSIPLAQYADGMPEQGWSLVARLTPQGGEVPPTYLTGHIDAPSGSAAYWLGLGTFSVALVISDNSGAVCRKEWTVTVNRWPTSGKGAYAGGIFVTEGAQSFDLRTQLFLGSKSPLGTPDGVVRTPVRKDSNTPRGTKSLTILLDAPSDPAGQLQAIDALEALMARIPAKSIRLVVFSLVGGYEIYRQNDFQLDSLGKVREALTSLGYRAVSVTDLQSHALQTPAKLLNSLVQREAHEAQRSDAVVFLGEEMAAGIPFRFSPELDRPLPPFFYLHLLRPALVGKGGAARAMDPAVSNSVTWVVQKLNGKTMNIGNAKQFDQAVEMVARTIYSARRE